MLICVLKDRRPQKAQETRGIKAAATPRNRGEYSAKGMGAVREMFDQKEQNRGRVGKARKLRKK